MALLWLAVDKNRESFSVLVVTTVFYAVKQVKYGGGTRPISYVTRLHALDSKHHLSFIQCLSFDRETPVDHGPAKPSAVNTNKIASGEQVDARRTVHKCGFFFLYFKNATRFHGKCLNVFSFTRTLKFRPSLP
jgi:hypothetical protein